MNPYLMRLAFSTRFFPGNNFYKVLPRLSIVPSKRYFSTALPVPKQEVSKPPGEYLYIARHYEKSLLLRLPLYPSHSNALFEKLNWKKTDFAEYISSVSDSKDIDLLQGEIFNSIINLRFLPSHIQEYKDYEAVFKKAVEQTNKQTKYDLDLLNNFLNFLVSKKSIFNKADFSLIKNDVEDWANKKYGRLFDKELLGALINLADCYHKLYKCCINKNVIMSYAKALENQLEPGYQSVSLFAKHNLMNVYIWRANLAGKLALAKVSAAESSTTIMHLLNSRRVDTYNFAHLEYVNDLYSAYDTINYIYIFLNRINCFSTKYKDQLDLFIKAVGVISILGSAYKIYYDYSKDMESKRKQEEEKRINIKRNLTRSIAPLIEHLDDSSKRINEIQRLIKDEKLDVNFRDQMRHNDTLLHYAVKSRDAELVSFLLSIGATSSINSANNYDITPFYLAAFTGETEIATLLYYSLPESERNAVINHKIKAVNEHCQTHLGWTPLIAAACTGDLCLIRSLLNWEANIFEKNAQEESAIDIAILYGHENVAKYLIRSAINLKKNVNVEGSNGQSFLYKAAKVGLMDVLRLLVENGADIRQTDKEGRTPLYVAAINGQLEVVRFLLKVARAKDIDIVMQTGNNHRTVMESIISIVNTGFVREKLNQENPGYDKYVSIKKELDDVLKSGRADLEEKIYDSASAEKGTIHIDFVSKFVQRGGNLLNKDKNGLTMVDYVVKYDKVMETDEHGNTIAHLLARFDDPKNESLQLMQKIYHSNPKALNSRNKLGMNPLYEACLFGSENIFDYLVEHAVHDRDDFDFFSKRNRSILTVAIWGGQLKIVEKIIRLLKENDHAPLAIKKPFLPGCAEFINRRAPHESMYNTGRTALYYAVEVLEPLSFRDGGTEDKFPNMIRLIELLLKNGANPDLSAEDKKNPLHLAAKYGLVKVVNCLLESGADTEILGGSFGVSPLHYAAINNRKDVIGTLFKHRCNPYLETTTTAQTALDIASSATRRVIEDNMVSGGFNHNNRGSHK